MLIHDVEVFSMSELAGQVTAALERMRNGEPAGQEELVDLVYAELRKMARWQMSRERAGHSLQPTALVNEAYVRLLGRGNVPWQNTAHFYAAAASAMRNVLVDHLRAVRAQKRGGGALRTDLSEVMISVEARSEEILAVHEALLRLQAHSPRQKTIVELRFFAGLTEEEIARALHLSVRQVKRDWASARAWLFSEIQGGEHDAPPQ